MPGRRTLLLAAVVLLCSSCAQKTEPPPAAAPAVPKGAPIQITAPLGLPPVPAPADNPPTAETVALGRRLYYDPKLSVDNTVSCASCHGPEHGFTDGKSFSEGVKGQKGGRNAPTVFNAAYFTLQFWDGRAPSLEKQAEGPMQNPIEMAHTPQGVEKRVAADPSYVPDFEKAFGPGRITFEKVTKAIASFERTVVSGNSPFDKFMYGGDKKALSAAAQRGLAIFRDPKKGNCNACHTIEEKYALFTDNKFHNLGVGADGDKLKDLGRYEVTKNEADKGAFKTPSLRNVTLTGPYMHDGSLATLKDVIDFYVGGGNSNPWRDKEIKSLDFLSRRDRDDLVAFMESLTGEIPGNVGKP
ncbi:MAG: cytochrome-c peroxidase [Acidobacteria bacterium]|nr:cytochrome-c peroxidase [Acidobacteriota bacterium]